MFVTWIFYFILKYYNNSTIYVWGLLNYPKINLKIWLCSALTHTWLLMINRYLWDNWQHFKVGVTIKDSSSINKMKVQLNTIAFAINRGLHFTRRHPTTSKLKTRFTRAYHVHCSRQSEALKWWLWYGPKHYPTFIFMSVSILHAFIIFLLVCANFTSAFRSMGIFNIYVNQSCI